MQETETKSASQVLRDPEHTEMPEGFEAARARATVVALEREKAGIAQRAKHPNADQDALKARESAITAEISRIKKAGRVTPEVTKAKSEETPEG